MAGKLFLLTGTSGAGKTTIAQHLLKRNPNLRRIVTYTTRAMREGEVDGVSYNFIDKETFQNMIEENQFMEWAEVYGNLYGETRADVQEFLEAEHDVLLVLDPQGAKSIKDSGFPATAIFLDAKNEEIIERLKGRGKDSKEAIQKRIASMEFDRSHIEVCDHVVMNAQGHIEEAIQKIEEIMANA